MSKREYYTELFVRLSWKILEHKWRYYWGVRHGVQPISDEKYDKIETNYKKLAKVLKLKTYASDMVGFDFDRPSCRIVHENMCRKYGIKKKDI